METSEQHSIAHMATKPVFAAVFIALFMVIFNFTLTNMAAIYIVGDLGGSNDTASYTISFFAVGNALGVPFGRALYERIGVLRMFLWSMVLFAFFSWMCGTAEYWALFLAYRFLQGLVAGPLYILCNRLLTVLGPVEKGELFTILTLAIFTVVPAVGASCGGWIAYEFHWRWNFYLDLPILLFLAAFIGYRLKGFDTCLKKINFDGIGYLFFFLGVFCISTALILGQQWDWFRSLGITALFLIGVPSLIFFVLWDTRHPNPIIALNLLKNPVFSYALINLAFLFSAYFGMIILLALWLGLYVNYTPIWIGVLIGTMAVAGLLPIFLTAKRFGHHDCRLSLICGVILLVISCFHTAIFNDDIDFNRIAASRIIAGFGFAFLLPPVFRLCFHTFQEELTPRVIGLFQVVRALSSGLGASIYTTLWQRRQVFYHDRMGGQLTIYSPETQQYLADAQEYHITSDKAYAQLNELLQRRATALALDDCFWLMAWLLVGLLALAALTLALDKRLFIPEHKEKDLYPRPEGS